MQQKIVADPFYVRVRNTLARNGVSGRKFAQLTNSLIVAGAGTKRIVQLSVNGRFVRQVDSMLRELNVRFRDIRQGPDECLYVLTEGRSRGNQDTDGMLLRIEPVPTTE